MGCTCMTVLSEQVGFVEVFFKVGIKQLHPLILILGTRFLLFLAWQMDAFFNWELGMVATSCRKKTGPHQSASCSALENDHRSFLLNFRPRRPSPSAALSPASSSPRIFFTSWTKTGLAKWRCASSSRPVSICMADLGWPIRPFWGTSSREPSFPGDGRRRWENWPVVNGSH